MGTANQDPHQFTPTCGRLLLGGLTYEIGLELSGMQSFCDHDELRVLFSDNRSW